MADEEEQRIRRWFFEDLEERVCAGCLETVDRVDHHNAPVGQGRRQRQELTELTHLIDADVAHKMPVFFVHQPPKLPHVRMTARLHESPRSGGHPRFPALRGPIEDRQHRPARRAAACAKVALPTPFGPASSHAWCSLRVAQALANCSTARSCPTIKAGGPVLPGSAAPSLVRFSRSVEQFHPLRLLCGDDMKRCRHLVVIEIRTAPDAIAAIRVADPRSVRSAFEHEHHRAVGKVVLDAELIECAYRFDPAPAPP